MAPFSFSSIFGFLAKSKAPVRPSSPPRAGSMAQPSGLLLVGSVPLASAADVFKTVTKELPNRLSSIPDGETGTRGYFIFWQRPVFPQAILQPRAGGPAPEDRGDVEYGLDDFKPTGYDEHAIQSYAVFKELQSAGTIPPHVRFQVSLPSPTTVTRMFVVSEHCAKAEALYEQRLLEALRRIQDSIPARQLLIQWDVPLEVCLLEHEAGRLTDAYFEPYFRPVKAGILERWARLAAAVDPDVEMGFHVCYGDVRHVHFVQPDDAALMVELANEITHKIAPVHPVKYIHMPVPKDRSDERFFKPLANLDLGPTKLFLGLIHAKDLEGTKKKVAAAQAVCSAGFGVTTECGLGRTSPQDLDSIWEISRAITAPGE